ncbi:hypothetical protein E2C01_025659 [Portunus trituberculatus]|uniref:Uncharacterized protein n=1 Tax=Portunus trituberculatus TaxID=210409 RepID=A0A5B7EGI8_PORTR|nr:hypothetical protein [Portunus trituberculatus]
MSSWPLQHIQTLPPPAPPPSTAGHSGGCVWSPPVPGNVPGSWSKDG